MGQIFGLAVVRRLLHAGLCDRVAYPLAADNVLGLLPCRLRGVNQPVMRTRNRFSRPRPALLACLWTHMGRSTSRFSTPPVLRPSVAAATAARDRAAPLSATRRDRSSPLPSPVYTAATPWRSPCRCWVQEPTGAGANSHAAGRNCSRRGTPSAAAVDHPRPCTVC
jgi:hypothetical protein